MKLPSFQIRRRNLPCEQGVRPIVIPSCTNPSSFRNPNSQHDRWRYSFSTFSPFARRCWLQWSLTKTYSISLFSYLHTSTDNSCNPRQRLIILLLLDPQFNCVRTSATEHVNSELHHGALEGQGILLEVSANSSVVRL